MPRIAFLISGQARMNGLGLNARKLPVILDSWTQYIFTDEFKATYDYDVFLTADNLDVNATLDYFGSDRVKNIHLLDTGYYMKPVTPIPPVGGYVTKINNDPRLNGYNRNLHHVHQMYKMYDVYNLMKESEGQYDYAVRLRFDIILLESILPYCTLDTVHIYLSCDMLAIGKIDIMSWLMQLILYANNYNPYSAVDPKDRTMLCWAYPNGKPYDLRTDWRNWTFATETQTSEHIRKYCKDNNLDTDMAVKAIGILHILRANGKIETWT